MTGSSPAAVPAQVCPPTGGKHNHHKSVLTSRPRANCPKPFLLFIVLFIKLQCLCGHKVAEVCYLLCTSNVTLATDIDSPVVAESAVSVLCSVERSPDPGIALIRTCSGPVPRQAGLAGVW